MHAALQVFFLACEVGCLALRTRLSNSEAKTAVTPGCIGFQAVEKHNFLSLPPLLGDK